jgi:hypothetical protein
MLLFTWKTRHLLDAAVQQLPDEHQRQLWQGWAKDNPQLRRPGGIISDQEPSPPREVLSVMLVALQRLEMAKRARLSAPSLSEDEASDLEDDLTYITALSQDLRQLPA